MLLVDRGIPEYDAHVVTLGFTEGKHERAREVAPEIVWLNVSKQDIGVNSKCYSQTITFPSHSIDHSCEGWDSERSEMLSEGRVELNARLVTFDFLDTGATHSDDVAIRIPLDVLDEHACVDEDGRVISHVAHQLHSATLVGNAKSGSFIVLVLV